MERSLVSVAMVAALFCACGKMDDSDGVDDTAEATEAAGHGTSPTQLAAVKGVAELFVQEDPTLDVAQDAGANADAIAARLKNSTMGCATATVTHVLGMTQVSVDFGAGCTLPPIGMVAGMAAVAVTRIPGMSPKLVVAFTFTNLAVNGSTLNGSFAAATTDGSSFTAQADLTTATQHLVFSGSVVLDGNGMGVTVDGTATSTVSGVSTMDAIAGVHHAFAGCYADAGTITLSKATKTRLGKATTISETMAFAPTTPSTGKVTVAINGGAANSVTLPAYGSCPK